MSNIVLRKFKYEDLDQYEYWSQPEREFHNYNGPYFRKQTSMELAEQIAKWKTEIKSGEVEYIKNWKAIADKDSDELIGFVSWYWKSEATNWLEVGIVIFNENFWGKGIGSIALEMWISEMFESKPEIVRVGLTTWSGNVRMMSLSEKLGLTKEAVYRKARIVDGKYYDSVSYGVLREEWKYI